MRNIWVLLAVITFSLLAFGQSVVPGTFTTTVVQTVPYAPVLSPPIATLGNGLTPTVVTNRPMLVYATPQNAPLEFSATSEATEGNAAAPATGTPSAVKRFDFVVAPGTYNETGGEQSPDLAAVARMTRKNAAPIAGRKITNDDILRMNQKSATPTQTTPPAPGPGNASAQN